MLGSPVSTLTHTELPTSTLSATPTSSPLPTGTPVATSTPTTVATLTLSQSRTSTLSVTAIDRTVAGYLAGLTGTLDLNETTRLLQLVPVLIAEEKRALDATARLEVCHLLLNLTAPFISHEGVASLLLDTLDIVLAQVDSAGPLLELLDAVLAAAIDLQGTSAFQAVALQSTRLYTSVRWLNISAVAGALTLRNHTTVHLPDTLAGQLGSNRSGVLLVTHVLPSIPGLLTEVVSVTFRDVATYAEIPIADLMDPIAISFTAAGSRQPASDWYRCVYEDQGVWSPDGTWLAPSLGTPLRPLEALTCYTAHLTAFAVEPVVRIEAVRGCAVDVAPSSLHCASGFGSLTVAGGNFGMEGASVTLIPGSTGQEWPCGDVTHADPDGSAVVCKTLVSPFGIAGPQWVDVRVTTQHGPPPPLTYPDLLPVAEIARPKVGHAGVRAGASPEGTPELYLRVVNPPPL